MSARWSWHGMVALVLALGVAAGFAAALIGVAFYQDTTISEQGAQLLGLLGGGMLTAVGTFLGGQIRDTATTRERNRHDDDDDTGPGRAGPGAGPADAPRGTPAG